ncbi:MAG: N-acetylneuraminate synthase family protein [Phycisphaerae bacterium]|nr:N-acetylneuraminate synthase family protein [Phycisphaerae bacterium]
MKIGARDIGPGHVPYVIAEIGVNHDGSVERGLELIDAAAHAGADAVKLQFFRAELLMSKASRLARYQRHAGESDPFAMLKRLELTAEQLTHLVFRAHQKGVHAIVSVFSLDLVPEAGAMNWDAFKTASPDIVHKPLLDALAARGKPLIISTGASSLEEVARASGWLRKQEVAFLQCVSSYPTPEDHAAVGAIADLAKAIKRVVGYSDHTTRVETAAVAVGAGASILEKHLTLSRLSPGPDHAASLEPAGFAEYVRLAQLAHRLVGDGRKRILDPEHDVREASRQSIVAARNIPRGRMIDPSDLTAKRPGTGLPPYMLNEIAGRVAARDIEADMPIRKEDLL